MSPPARCPWLFGQAYAHRGLWLANGPPENSMAAFEAAARAGLGAELDVRVSADGEPMVIHDATLARTAEAEGAVAACTAQELARIPLKGAAGGVPHLGAVLAAFPDMPLLVEMKVHAGEEGPLESAVAGLLAGRAGPTAVMSFNPRSLAAFAERAPQIARGQLTGGFRLEHGAPIAPLTPQHTSGAEISAPDFLSCNVDALAAYGAPAAERLGLALVAWTVRTPAHLTLARSLAGAWIFEALPVESVAPSR